MCVRSSTTSYGSFNLDMDRSPGFGSMISDSVVLLTLAFASAPDLKSLTLPLIITRRTVLQKVRRRTYRAPTACKHRVSGSLSLPSRGPFHLSFTVLYAIGHWVVFRVGGWSPHLPTRFHVSGRTLELAQLLSFSPTWFSHSLTGLPMPFG